MNKSKAKGTRAETAVARYLAGHGWTAERKALSGSSDKGDLKAVPPKGRPLTIEVKAGKMTANPSRLQLEEWLRQAKVEAENSGESASYLVVVRYRRALKDADVYAQYRDGDGYPVRAHMFLDEFAEGR